MNAVQHYRSTRKTSGFLISLLSILPDIFVVLRKTIPIRRVSKFCLEMHHSRKIRSWNNIFGRAWTEHAKQDISSHDLDYSAYEITPKDSVLLISGGLDSFIQWRLLNQPRAVYFAIGHRYQERELEKINAIKKRFGGEIIIEDRLKLGDYEMDNAYIPFRNLLFITLASFHSQNIILCQIAEWSPDKNKNFYKKTMKLLKDAGTGQFQEISSDIKIWTPFQDYTKTELVREYCQRWSTEDLTNYTVSCYSGNQVNCGKCTACFSRWVAMTNNEIQEKYLEVPRLENFRSKLSLKDFRIGQLGMYIKRWLEIRQVRY